MDMLNIKYGDIWKILDEYTFDVNDEHLSEIMCILCQSILKNAHQNICGCRYCYACILNYVRNGNQYCPGITDECKENSIDIDLNIQIDHGTNRKISRIVVNCPFPFCSTRVELKCMDDHIKSHKENCPYSGLGCYISSCDMGNLKNHLENEKASHGELVMNSIENFKNQINELRINSKEKDIQIARLQKSLDESSGAEYMRRENTKWQKEKQALLNKLEAVQLEADKKQKVITEMELMLGEVNSKVIVRHEQIEARLEKLFYSGEKCSMEQDKMQENIDELASRTEQQNTTFRKYRTRIEDRLGDMYSYNDKLSHSKLPVAPFEWRVMNFSISLRKAQNESFMFLLSPAFYLHEEGYRMRLKIYPRGDEMSRENQLAVMLTIVKGDNDDVLRWPMIHTVAVHLLDQTTGKTHIVEKFNYYSCSLEQKIAFHRPESRVFNNFGSSDFINVNVLFNNKKVLKDDSLVFVCSLDA